MTSQTPQREHDCFLLAFQFGEGAEGTASGEGDFQEPNSPLDSAAPSASSTAEQGFSSLRVSLFWGREPRVQPQQLWALSQDDQQQQLLLRYSSTAGPPRQEGVACRQTVTESAQPKLSSSYHPDMRILTLSGCCKLPRHVFCASAQFNVL